MEELAKLFVDEREGCIEFTVQQKELFDPDTKEYTIIYKLLGDSKFKLFRNNKFEIIFVHVNEDWLRQARFDLKNIDYSRGIDIKLSWNKDENILAVKEAGKPDYTEVKALHIDN